MLPSWSSDQTHIHLIHPFLGGDWRSWWLGGSRWSLPMLTEGWIAPFVLICASLSTLGFEVAKLALENVLWCPANYFVGMVTWCNKNPAGFSGDSCLPYARSGICICHYWWIYARCLKLTKKSDRWFETSKSTSNTNKGTWQLRDNCINIICVMCSAGSAASGVGNPLFQVIFWGIGQGRTMVSKPTWATSPLALSKSAALLLLKLGAPLLLLLGLKPSCGSVPNFWSNHFFLGNDKLWPN